MDSNDAGKKADNVVSTAILIASRKNLLVSSLERDLFEDGRGIKHAATIATASRNTTISLVQTPPQQLS